MFERMTTRPAHSGITCKPLPSRETTIAHHEMLNASGGMMFLGEDLYELVQEMRMGVDDVFEFVSEVVGM